MCWIDSPFVQERLDAGVVEIVPAETAKEISDAIDKLPWLPTRLNWAELPESTSLDTERVDPETDVAETMDWFAETEAGICPYLVLLLTSENMLIGEAQDVLKNVFYLSGPSTGNYPLIGAHKEGVVIVPRVSALMEKHQAYIQAVVRFRQGNGTRS